MRMIVIPPNDQDPCNPQIKRLLAPSGSFFEYIGPGKEKVMFRRVYQFSSVGRVRSAQTAFRQTTGIVASGEGVEIIVLERLFIFCTLHELGYGVLSRLLASSHNLESMNTYTRHELKYRDLGVFEKFGDLLETFDHGSILSNSLGHPCCKLIS